MIFYPHSAQSRNPEAKWEEIIPEFIDNQLGSKTTTKWQIQVNIEQYLESIQWGFSSFFPDGIDYFTLTPIFV